jgi:hypothetical protein
VYINLWVELTGPDNLYPTVFREDEQPSPDQIPTRSRYFVTANPNNQEPAVFRINPPGSNIQCPRHAQTSRSEQFL